MANYTNHYKNLRATLKTGDIVLFSGKSPVSAMIKLTTKSPWSHVGMVMRLESYDTVLLWESTGLKDIPDVEDGTAEMGVQLVPMSERVASYDGEVSLRSIDNYTCDETTYQTLSKFRRAERKKPFDWNILEAFKAAYDGPFGKNNEDFAAYFCSELVAETYEKMGLLPGTEPANEYTPRDFSSAESLALLRGAQLENEMPIKVRA